MLTQLISIGFIMLLSAMLPGPDFAIVTKNSILHSRRAGLFTTLGISAAVMVHMTYCLLGLAWVISQSIILFNVIKYIGAAYLVYLGVSALLAKQPAPRTAEGSHKPLARTGLSDFTALRQGFLCNLLNPKATLFFLALFTVIIKPGTPTPVALAFAVEMLVICLAWFTSLTILLSHPRMLRAFSRVEHYISKVLGVFLVGFGVALAFVRR
jgi:RhtB (resistance to homoserine/threonine) family protein